MNRYINDLIDMPLQSQKVSINSQESKPITSKFMKKVAKTGNNFYVPAPKKKLVA
jgi:hypothetical protein